MPERILRDWTDSEKFDALSSGAETLFTRLVMKVDDYGRFSRDPVNVRGACFPRVENLRANTVDAWLKELSDHHLILCYQVGSKPLLAIINFRQRLRVPPPKPKFPPPDGKLMEFRPDDGDWRESMPVVNSPQTAAVRGSPQPYAGSVAGSMSLPESGEYLTSKLSLGGLQRGVALVLGADWWWDNCKVARDFTNSSLMTVLRPYVGRICGRDILPAWKKAVVAAHQAVVDGLEHAQKNPQGYCISCWREELDRKAVNGDGG